jgi:hypothetical protein
MSFTHPGMLEVPADFEACTFFLSPSSAESNASQALKARSTNPLLLNTCEFDPPFPPEAQKQVDALLGGGQYPHGYERTYWDGCKHGFAVRGDLVRA